MCIRDRTWSNLRKNKSGTPKAYLKITFVIVFRLVKKLSLLFCGCQEKA
jgi:hypothetical protein